MGPDTSTPKASSHSALTRSPNLTTTAQTAGLDIATKAMIKAQEVVQAAADTVDQNRWTAARVLANAAATIHEGAPRLPGGERVSLFAQGAADEIDATAQYIRGHDPQQMVADLKQFVMGHPGASVIGAALVGLLVGRRFRK